MGWSQSEVEATVDSYFGMLASELAGEAVNKAAENRVLRTKLDERSKGAVEYKHQNISAVLLENGWLYIDGYKPAVNVQKRLRDEVEKRLRFDAPLEVQMSEATSTLAELTFFPPSNLAPEDQPEFLLGHAEWVPRKIGLKRDYAYQDQRNRSLGLAGELSVVEFERSRLEKVGKRKLAGRVEHVSEISGDGLGYDVLSFDADGRERHIEVKTTLHSEKTPFFVSSNEVKASIFFDETYWVYRLFRFTKRPSFYQLNGSLVKTCQLEPMNYMAAPRSSNGSLIAL